MAPLKANPKPEVPEVTPTMWPLQDQLRFLPWIASTFEYSDDAHAEAEGRVLMDQQKFVRDYLQHDSPYRGLLLLHSLGVGKTCAAIAAAEALRPSRTGGVFVMTTKMLHASFAKEVPLCAAPSLQRRQRWRRVPATDPLAAATASKMTAKMLKAHGGVWVPQGRDEEGQEYVEYDDLDATEQEGIDSQVDAIIDATFHFVHYNGLTKERVDQMFQGGTNPFDGAVVIIDEVHNFVSRVMNKRLVAPLYERLLDAVDCKVILLSGTPIVNRTAELAYLINLVQGRTVIHLLQLIDESSMEAIQEALDAADVSRMIQEVSYEPSTRRVRVVFAPVGFEMSADNAGMVHRVRDDDERPTSMTSPSIERVTRALGDAHIRVKARNSMTALPLPDDVDDFDAHFVDWEQGTIVNPVLLQRRIVGAVSSYSLRDKTFFASVSPINIVQVEMSGLQFVKYSQLRYEERRRERNVQRFQVRARGRKPSGEVDNLGQVYRTFSLAACTFVFPDEITRPFKFQMRQKLREDSGDVEVDAVEVDREYERTLELATRRLKIEMPDSLRMEGTLAVHSPKFLALLQYLQGSPGPALVYSQFRRAEGLGLLASTLDVNGWVEFRLVRSQGAWVYSSDSLKTKKTKTLTPKKTKKTKKTLKSYIILRTEEDPECNRLLLNIFNNEFDQLPRATRDSLPTETNLHGECARVFMITASGAEGISLKNVRQVHMIEGFWNHNRLDQVIGRAVRARSHIDLPEAERHVDVFLYLSTFTDDQRLDHAIMHIDKGLTSDQYVHTVAMKKKHLTDQVLSLIRAASVDCAVHDKDEKACFNLPQTADGQERFRTTEFASDLDDAAYARRIVKLVVVSLDNQTFYLDRRAGILYDYDKLKAENVLLQVGKV